MATETIELEAAVRDRVGKGAARHVRRQGRVPAVIYGDKKEPQSISLDYNEVWKLYRRGQMTGKVFKLRVEGEEHKVISRDLQLDPVRDTPIHVDFLRIGAGDMIRVEVPVRFLNEESCPGLRRGGVLNVVRHEIEIWCPPESIPDAFVIDLAQAQIGDSIHISAITMPPECEPTIQDRDFTIVTVVGRGPQEETEEAEGETEEAEEKEKKEE